ncbi:MAG: ABC transporter ATP-binding protein [Zetaproteobacteria bacterium CG_4_9_14_3_um_filter_49_83]|nr:MAG: ABC transporter ATP-binding protein [Zetaproteobacteria bacterium CG1_02_49_23]PIQ30032.1 MAG: ABC transporter ATP-binding protein [Zetaproteobacteria bacterium CG17_big_fil_post_rev_8_21_14_2_50_50_13]PIV29226.1 MAG: ABC transporter ATP-binding protein [Zetaproteobacteria bacterium CG02_land_8_20_14_3_00_50_9]PIY56020.1 MAG: ABC transporter ATP-binding protein [Zetaproteobacteria bacterium CG_4_10_14_0_8_um_filter_49_80]PJA36303.1 MAG: ABC transporter ATP-binding protein [Zetaproteobac
MIRVEKLSRTFGEVAALNAVDLQVRKHQTTVIMGGSGSGKTTLLRMLAALDKPSSGHVWFDGHDLASIRRKELYELRARMGMVFQYSALLNSLNVYDNVAFTLHEHTQLDESIIRTMVTMKLEQVGLRGFESFMPSELSGGMAKRVAFARALAMDPEIVFFDEPTSGLDPISAGVIATLIKDLTQKTHMTSVVVTHDVHAGLQIADYIILLWQGDIIAEGTPDEIRQHADERVQQFLEGRPDGPIPFSRSKTAYIDDLLHKPGVVRIL